MPSGRTERALRATNGTTFRRARLEGLEERRLLALVPELVGDIDTYETDSRARDFIELGDLIYFVAFDDVHGEELRTTRGNAGDSAAVIEIVPGLGSPGIQHLTVCGQSVYFVAATQDYGQELWIIDAPDVAPRLYYDFRPGRDGSAIQRLACWNETIFAVAAPSGRYELWTSDGTPGGTRALTSFSETNPFVDYMFMAPLDDAFVFAAKNANYELWRTDGTIVGTTLLRSFGTNRLDANESVVVNNMLFFIGIDGDHGDNPWRTDGTIEGTIMLADTYPGTPSGRVAHLTAWDNQIVFQAVDPEHAFETWVSDGTPEGTRLLVDTAPGDDWGHPYRFTPIGDDLYFMSNHVELGRQLWRYNRVTDAATLVTGVAPSDGLTFIRGLTALNNALYFLALADATPEGLWTTNGSPEGTTRVLEDIPGARWSVPPIVIAGRMVFDVVTATGEREPWVTDGTPEQTYQLADIRVGTSDANPREFTRLGDYLYFIAHVYVNLGTALFRTPLDGSGVELVKGGFNTAPANLVAAGSRLYFTAGDALNGVELWTSDGTTTGTVMVKNISAGNSSTKFKGLFSHGEHVLFFTDDGGELWKSDGTAEGTVLVHDFGPARIDTLKTAVLDGHMYFWVTSTGFYYTLWRTDGTEQGTTFVRQVYDPTPITFKGQEIVSDGNRLYFSASDEQAGVELWTSDGTSEGSRRVSDINPATAPENGSHPTELVATDHGIYFFAQDPIHGRELWRSDGTESGTSLVADIRPGEVGSNPGRISFRTP